MADDRARIEDAVASHFHTVPQHGTEFLKAGRDLFFSVLYHHQCLVGFYIGGDGTGAHMCPVAQNGIAHIIVMGHLHPIEKHHVFQLCGVAHHGVLSHNGVAADEGAVADLRLFADDGRAVDISRGRHGGRTGDPHVLAHLLIVFCRKGGAQFFDKRTDIGQRLPGISQALEQFRRDSFL